MLCITLKDYVKACGATTGGVSDLAIFDPADMNFIQTTLNGSYSSVNLRPGATANDGGKMFPVSFQENEAERTWKHSKTGSSVKFEHEVKAQLPQLSQQLTNFLQALDDAGVCCGLGLAIRHNDGKIFIAGEKFVNGSAITKFTVNMNGSDGASGKKFEDFNGANVLFKGDYRRDLYEYTGTWDSLFNIAEATPATPFTFEYGYADASEDIDAVLIAAASTGTANEGAKIVVANFGNATNKFLYVAEPTTEPDKTTWFNSTVNQGPVGAGQTWLSPVVIGTYKVYITAFATKYTGSLELRP